MKRSDITISVSLDENQVPDKIKWKADGTQDELAEAKAMMLAFWDKKENNTMRIDLWTKDMLIDEMKQFFHQTLLTMADTFEKATGEAEMSRDLRDFCDYFADRLQILSK